VTIAGSRQPEASECLDKIMDNSVAFGQNFESVVWLFSLFR